MGDDWLKDKEAVSNYTEGIVTLIRNERGRKHILKQTAIRKQKRCRPDLMLVRRVEDISDPMESESADFSKVPEPYREFVEKYADIWPKDLPAGLPPSRPGVELVIPFEGDAIPVASYRVRYSPAEIEEARTQVKRFLEKGFVRPSTSPYGASVLFTPKKDGGLRMCVDYKRFNAQNNEDESLEDKQKVNEASFLDRIRQPSKRDAILTQKGLRKRPIERDGLWWKTTEGEHMALYIPKDVGSALRLECIEWVHVHPFSGHVGRDRTT